MAVLIASKLQNSALSRILHTAVRHDAWAERVAMPWSGKHVAATALPDCCVVLYDLQLLPGMRQQEDLWITELP